LIRFRNLAARLIVLALASGALVTIPAPANATTILTVSVSNPIMGEQVTITATGIAQPEDYDVVFVGGLKSHPETFTIDFTVWVGSLDPQGSWTGAWGTGFQQNNDDASVFPGVLKLRPKDLRVGGSEGTLIGPVVIEDLVGDSNQIFPGKDRITPSLSFTGPGFVRGSFVPGESFSVTGTGFPTAQRAASVTALVFPNPSPSNDINVDFWLWYFTGGYASAFSNPQETFLFYQAPDVTRLEPDLSNPANFIGNGTGANLTGKSIWLYYIDFDTQLERIIQFGYGVYTTSALAELDQTPPRQVRVSKPIEIERPSNYFIAQGFKAGQAKLNKPMRKFIQKELGTKSGEVNVVCTGTVRGTIWTPKKEKLALDRAASGCDYLRKLSPGVSVELRKRLIPKGKGDPHTVRIRVLY
jgi:hypothetical protein